VLLLVTNRYCVYQRTWKGYETRNQIKSFVMKEYESIVKEIEGYVAEITWTSNTSFYIPKPIIRNVALDDRLVMNIHINY
jgi:hypothetical protein